jgi:MFS family permease
MKLDFFSNEGRNLVSNLNNILPYIICISSGLFFMYEFFQLSMFNNLNEILREEYNITGLKLTRLSNAFTLGNILFLLPAGVLLDRHSTKKIILITMTVCVIGTLGIALSTNLYLTAFFRFLTGIGNAFCLAAGIILIYRWLPENKQALFTGLLVTMAYFGGILNGSVFLYCIDSYGWRNAVMLVFLMGLIILLWLLIILKDSPDPNFGKLKINRVSKITTGLKEALTNSQNWLGGMYVAFINLPIIILGAVWGKEYFNDVYHLKSALWSEVIVSMFLGAMIGCPLFGWISDKISRRKPIMYFGCIASILIFLPIFWGLKLSFFNLCLLFFLIGFNCGTQIVGYSLIAESNKSTSTAKATSIATFLVMLLGSGCSSIYAIILDNYNFNNFISFSSLAFQKASLIFLIAFGLALIMSFFIKETYCKKMD